MPSIKQRPAPDSSDLKHSELHPLLKHIFSIRGIQHPTELDLSLSRLLLPDSIKSMASAIALLHKALTLKQRILVIGDYDADGATSCALAVLALRAMGASWVDFLVPDRFRFGYGLTVGIVEQAKTLKPDLIITVDNGIANHDGVQHAKQAGITVLITDHHLPSDTLPNADAIINPNQIGCSFPSKHLAGVGVIFYTLSALRRHLIETNYFDHNNLIVPNMAQYLDLVALGTVADVVPLDYNNRILVQNGLHIIKTQRARPGFYALFQLSNKNYRSVCASDLAFVLGPKLNAAGRMDDMSIGINALLAEDINSAMHYARRLNHHNHERRTVEQTMTHQADQIIHQLAGMTETTLPMALCLYDESWHQGVIGIVASRVKDRWHRPVIAFAPSEDGAIEIKGSARSITGFHIRDALANIAAQHPTLINKFGGHAMAAGLTLNKDQFEAFNQAFCHYAQQHLEPELLQQDIFTDGPLDAENMTLEVAQLIKTISPWGHHFPEPLFEGTFTILERRVLKEKHLKLNLSLNEHIFEAIAFNVDFENWPLENKIRLVYRLDINEFRNTTKLQLIIEYATQPAIH